ncbi:PREDICTED: uncharacterized protein LOC101312358 [Fragaria vesca subsp. vesca]
MALDKPDLGFVKDLVPNLQFVEGNSGHDLLLVQANFFECDGVAIGLEISHKIIDAFTISTFLTAGLQFPVLSVRCAKSYASRSRVSTDLEMCDESINCKLGFCKTIIVDMVANGEHAENIGATICGEHDGEPFGVISSKWTRGESEDDLQGLVAAMRKGYDEFKVNWCRLVFYETDFGWGKPLMVVPPTEGIKNMTMMKDTSDGHGIEAHLTLKEEDMAIFEKNEELLAYASLNPCVI